MVSGPRSSVEGADPLERAADSADGAFTYRDLHLEITGNSVGEPVILLHGWGSNAENMRPIARGLEGEFHLYNLDLPGHGHSPPPPEPMGVPEHAELVAELIRNEIGMPATIVGHSNGGRIALFMASDPDLKALVRRLVLISPSGITPTRSAGYHVRKTVAALLKAPFRVLPPRLREFGLDWLRHSLVWRALGSSDYRELEGTMRATFVKTVTHHLDERVHRIEAPTLLLWGEKDTAVPREQMAVLERGIPDSGLIVLEGAGHYGYLDAFDTFIGSTRYFLSHS